MAPIPRSFRSMPPRVASETPWVRGAAPAPMAAAPMPTVAQLDDMPFDTPTVAQVASVVEPPMTFVPSGTPPLKTQEAKMAAHLAERHPFPMAPARPKLSPEAEALNAMFPETPDDAICDLLDEVAFETEEDEIAQADWALKPPPPAPEFEPDKPWAGLPPLGMAPPRRPPPVPPAPPSSGLLSSRVGTIPVPVRRPPVSPLSVSTKPATGRDD